MRALPAQKSLSISPPAHCSIANHVCGTIANVIRVD